MNAQCSKETAFKLFEPCGGAAKETFEIPERFAALLLPGSKPKRQCFGNVIPSQATSAKSKDPQKRDSRIIMSTCLFTLTCMHPTNGHRKDNTDYQQ